jgi:hypothetical protein
MLGHSQPYHFVKKSSQCASKLVFAKESGLKCWNSFSQDLSVFKLLYVLVKVWVPFRGFFSKYELAGPKLLAIRVICEVTLSSPSLSPPVPSFSGICKVRKFLLNLSNGTQQGGRS